MSYAALAEQGTYVAAQYGVRLRPAVKAKPTAKRKSTSTPRPAQTSTEGKYAKLCATILEMLRRTGKLQKNDMPMTCFTSAEQSQHEFARATILLKGKISYVGHAPLGHWRMK